MDRFNPDELIELLMDVRENNQWDFDENYYSFQQGMTTHEERIDAFEKRLDCIIRCIKNAYE